MRTPNRTGVLLSVKYNGGQRYIRIRVSFYYPYHTLEYKTSQTDPTWSALILYLHNTKTWVTVGTSGWIAYLDKEHKRNVERLLAKLRVVEVHRHEPDLD